MTRTRQLNSTSQVSAPTVRAAASVVALAIALCMAAMALRSINDLPRYVAWQALAGSQVLMVWLATLAAWETPSRRAWMLPGALLALALPSQEWTRWRLDGWDSLAVLAGSGLLFAAAYPLGWSNPPNVPAARRLSAPQFWLLVTFAVGLLLSSFEPGWLGASADVLVLGTELLLVALLLARRAWLAVAALLLVAPALAGALEDVDALRRGGILGWIERLASPEAAFPYGLLLARACGYLVDQDALWGLRHEVAAIAMTTTLVVLAMRAAGLRHLTRRGAALSAGGAEVVAAATRSQDQPGVDRE